MKFIPWLVSLIPVLRELFRAVGGDPDVAALLIRSRIDRMRENQGRIDARIDDLVS